MNEKQGELWVDERELEKCFLLLVKGISFLKYRQKQKQLRASIFTNVQKTKTTPPQSQVP